MLWVSAFQHVLLWLWSGARLPHMLLQWTYLCSVGSKLQLFALEPPSTDNCVSWAVLSISSSRSFMFCASLSFTICSCCSFSNFLCCVMICCWTAYLFSNLLPGGAGLFRGAETLLSTLWRASWSSTAVGAAWRRVTCHGCVGWSTAATGALFSGIAEALGTKVHDLWWSAYDKNIPIIYGKMPLRSRSTSLRGLHWQQIGCQTPHTFMCSRNPDNQASRAW